MGREIQLRALVLSRKPHGENFLNYRLLTAEEGLVTALLRQSRKHPERPPDLFETIDGHLEQGKGEGPYFLQSYESCRERSAIARQYKRLETASHFTRFLLHNLPHMPYGEEVFDLVERAFDHWAGGKPDQLVYIKVLFLLARLEGFPVKEDWLAGLDPERQALVLTLLKTGLEEATPATPQPEPHLVQSLERFIMHETALQFPQN